MKNVSWRKQEEIKELCGRYQVPFVINDNVEIAAGGGRRRRPCGTERYGGRRCAGPTWDRTRSSACPPRRWSRLSWPRKPRGRLPGSGRGLCQQDSKADASEVDHETVKAICQAVDIPVIAIGGITRGKCGRACRNRDLRRGSDQRHLLPSEDVEEGSQGTEGGSPVHGGKT